MHFYEPNAFTLEAIVHKWGKTVPESELRYNNPYGSGVKTLSGEEAIYDNIGKPEFIGGQTVVKGNPLFPRLDATIEVPFIQDLMAGNK